MSDYGATMQGDGETTPQYCKEDNGIVAQIVRKQCCGFYALSSWMDGVLDIVYSFDLLLFSEIAWQLFSASFP